MTSSELHSRDKQLYTISDLLSWTPPAITRIISDGVLNIRNKMLIFGERHLRYVVNEYMEHYHTERPHQGIGNNIIDPPPLGNGRIVCHERLGGLLKSYRRAA